MRNIESYQSDIFSVINKKRELNNIGYKESFSPNEDELAPGEFCLVLPHCEKTGALQGLDKISIFWCTS